MPPGFLTLTPIDSCCLSPDLSVPREYPVRRDVAGEFNALCENHFGGVAQPAVPHALHRAHVMGEHGPEPGVDDVQHGAGCGCVPYRASREAPDPVAKATLVPIVSAPSLWLNLCKFTSRCHRVFPGTWVGSPKVV